MATNFETKKINELTEAAEVEDSDLTVTGDPGTGLLKKITFKNLILSIKDRLLGNTSEIADMGDGTVTGAIKQLDSDISDTQEITTDAFDETKSYAVGDYCIYDNTLYKFKEEKSAGEWDDEAVEKTNTMTELNSSVSTLNSALAEKVNSSNYLIGQQGSLNAGSTNADAAGQIALYVHNLLSDGGTTNCIINNTEANVRNVVIGTRYGSARGRYIVMPVTATSIYTVRITDGPSYSASTVTTS